MSDEWLAQLRQLYETDKAQREAEAAQQAAAQQQEAQQHAQAIALLQHSRAHELLRQVQKALLNGQGTLELYDNPRKYDRAIVLAWQGPISAAQRPNPKKPGEFFYILVGVRQAQLWVNHQPVNPPTPAALKAALLKAAQNPAVQRQKTSEK